MSKKLLVAGVMLALVATVVGGVSVMTASAQSMSLCQTVDALVLAGVIAPDKVAAAKAAAGCSAVATPASYTFTRNLTIGSTGADVTALQTKLGVTPATGYFGSITKAAVVAYQTANGISGTGYVGPVTLASLNAGSVTTTTTSTTCPAGMTCTPVVACPAGFTCTSSTAPAAVTNGVEGQLTVKSSTVDLPSTIYEGDSKVAVLAFKAEAKDSDITIQRVKIGLGTSTQIYTKVFNKIYVLDGSTVLASADLNSDTVVKESDNTYTISLSGMNVVVAKDGSKVLKVAVDVNSTVDSSYRGTSRVFTMVADGVRGVDGAGLNQVDPSTAFSRTISSISTTLAERATLKVSTNSATPSTASIVASAGSNKDEADKVVGLLFNVKAEKDTVKITDLTVTATGTAVSTGATNGQVTTAYLYDGATEVANAEVTASSTDVSIEFTDIAVYVAQDTTKVLTVKFDVRNATSSAKTVTLSVANANITAENTLGDSVTGTYRSGSAAGNQLSVVASGPVLTLVSKSTSVSRATDTNGNATSTLTASFVYRVLAGGQDVVMGTVGSTTAFASTTSFTVYKNSVAVGTALSQVTFDTPSSGVTVDTTNKSMTLADGNTVDITVSARLTVSGTAGGADEYAIQTASILGLTFMNTSTDWRTSSGVTLP